MKLQAANFAAGLGMLGLAGCTAPPGSGEKPPMPPPWAEQDRTVYNNQQVVLFAAQDPGWQAWLNAVRASQQANDILVGASRYNTPVEGIIQAIAAAQGAYKVATSFNLPPFTVTSSCLNLPSEVNGAARLGDGLTLRYGFVASKTAHFENGSSCRVSIGFIDEIDSSRGQPVAIADGGRPIDWTQSFAPYLIWRQPYWELSTGTTLSLSDIVTLIER